jgi:hypothetical protein
MTNARIYEVRPRKDHRGSDLISDALPFGRLSYTKPDDAVDYAKFSSRSHHAVIRVYDDAGKMIQTHEHADDFSRLPHRKGSADRHLLPFPVPQLSNPWGFNL